MLFTEQVPMFLQHAYLRPRWCWNLGPFREPEVLFFALPGQAAERKPEEEAGPSSRRHLDSRCHGAKCKNASPCKRKGTAEVDIPLRKAGKTEKKTDGGHQGEWRNSLHFRGYQPEDIDVKVQENGISIKAVKEEKSRSGFSLMRTTRFVSFPPDIQKEGLNVWMDRSGELHMQAPRCALGQNKPGEKMLTLEKKKESEASASKDLGADKKDSAEAENTDTDVSKSKENEALPLEKSSEEVQDATKKGDISESEMMDTDATRSKECAVLQSKRSDGPDVHAVSEVEKSEDMMEAEIVEKDLNLSPEKSDEDKTEEQQKTGDLLDETEKQEDSFFKVDINVSSYDPSSVSVKVAGRHLVIQADETVEEEGMCFENHITRRVTLPDDVDTESISSSLNDEGRLRITGSKITTPDRDEEVSIDIKHV